MFVPMWLVWVVVALALLPLTPALLMLLFWVYVRGVTALFPPKPGSIVDPMGYRLAEGTPSQKWFQRPPGRVMASPGPEEGP